MGFSEEFDEWRDYDCENDYFLFIRLEKMFLPNGGSTEDRRNIFHGQLYRVIKRKLRSGRRDDSEVRIEMNVDPDVFSMYRTSSSHSEHFTARKRYLRRN